MIACSPPGLGLVQSRSLARISKRKRGDVPVGIDSDDWEGVSFFVASVRFRSELDDGVTLEQVDEYVIEGQARRGRTEES